MGLGSMMAGGNSATGRVEDDFYPTPPEATEALMQVIAGTLDKSWTIHEPCCGDGAMAKVIAGHGFKVESTDIKPRGFGEEADYRELIMPQGQAVITNPPFTLAPDLITHALWIWEVDFLALLLKSTFFHAADRTSLFNRFRPSLIMPLPWRLDFQNRGRPTMECSWFIWDRRVVKGLPEDPDTAYRIAPNLNPKRRAKS